MGKELLTYGDLLQIVELIKSAEAFSEFHLKVGDIELDLRKANGAMPPAATPASSTTGTSLHMPPAQSAGEQPAIVRPAGAHPPAARSEAASTPATSQSAGAPRTARPAIEVPAGSVAITSPMVGTFYRAPEPGAKPFVEAGQKVAPDTTVCIIEVMKLMNSIPAGVAGTVTHVLVDDAEPVDAGQVIIIIDPKA